MCIRDRHCVGVISNGNIELNTQPGVIANIHSDNSWIDVDGANDLRALLIEIPQRIFGHLSAAILHHADFFTIDHCKIPHFLNIQAMLIVNSV